jgi:diguanylate cyclase (GGDEF)-like protein
LSAVPAAREQTPEQSRLRRWEPVASTEHPQTPAEVWVTLGAGALVMPFWALVLIVPAVHVTGLLVRRQASWSRWLHPAVSLVAAAAAGLAAQGVLRNVAGDPRLALAGLAAGAAGIAAHRLLLERSLTGLEADAVGVAVGVVFGALWLLDPWMIPIAALPPLLIRRSLSLPRLQHEARVDAKTGLYNARFFAQALDHELARARRYRRPLSLIMVDLDLLRRTNNTYGHLAGDAVLEGVAEIFRLKVRAQDVAARFGGEEFAILLPETDAAQALELAERIRRAVAVTLFRTETAPQPLRATISVGVAAFPRDAADVTQLVHRADLAVYRAKLEGRNRVVDAAAATE